MNRFWKASIAARTSGEGGEPGSEPREVRRPGKTAVGHDHDHGLGLLRGQKIVEDEAGPADRAPARVVVAGAVEQVQDGVLVGTTLVAGRGVEVQPAELAERARLVPGCADLAVGHVFGGLEVSLVARHEEHAVDAREPLLDHRVLGVDGPDAVHVERVAVKVGRQRSDGDRPDALFVLGELAPPPKSPPTETSLAFGA